MQPVQHIDDLSDSRLASYHNLRNRNPIAGSGYFVVESQLLVQRLVDSDYEIDSILVDDEKIIDSTWLDRQVPIYCVPDVSSLIGFHFHRGALACGRRRLLASASDEFERLQKSSASDLSAASKWQAVYLHQVQDPENMGSIFRTCAALGVNRVIIGRSCVDPYARRVVRVAMGTSLKLQLMSDANPESFMATLASQSISTVAATLSERASSIRQWQVPDQWTLFLGNEAAGLPESLVAQCSDHLTIPMKNGVDSLNVSNAAAIFLYVLSGHS